MPAAVAVPADSVAALVHRAATALAHAETAAEVLDARDKARAAYGAAKRQQRMLKAKKAHDEVVAAAKRARADALEIEALAERRLADEYDGAQARGEVSRKGQHAAHVPDGNMRASVDEIGLTRKDVFEARQIRDAIAERPGIVRQALDELLASGDEPTRAALKRTIAPVVKSIRADEQVGKKLRRTEREVALGARQAALPAKKYGIIVADPEWRFDPYSRDSGMDRAADNHYPTSELLDIMRRDVGGLAAQDCILFLWATAPMLVEAICVLDAWGFAWIERDPATGFLGANKAHARYISHFAWVKPDLITGYWNRGKHELLLIATRGKPVAPAMGTQLESALALPKGRHSQKPAALMDWIDTTWPNTPRIELNARTAREGWDVWGNEASACEPQGESPAKGSEGREDPGITSPPPARRKRKAVAA